jgi:hypothetical protein
MGTTHTVKQGETMIRIAHDYGFRSWETIWHHADNSALREKRPNAQALHPGDEVLIPDRIPKSVTVSDGRLHRFLLKKPKPALFQVWLKDETGAPFADRAYELTIDDEPMLRGRTASDGLVATEIKPTANHARLKVWLGESEDDIVEWQMKIGHLDPADTITGAQARLQNLGYRPGPIDGTLNEATKEALMNFQRHIGYDFPTGELDEKTSSALASIHDEGS